ncbi:MAG: phosphatidylserine/phosphatidylglycerophosphate/cardiolipin synthase family protein [Flavisolibacter sp.]|jgi:cardiolipin synthase|nr:phosphatidylserine/phosphatidylglycerophosphate/cardiolipin synthase family protein [Flavisolibacter sp.]
MLRRKKRKALFSNRNKARLVQGGTPFFETLQQLIANAKQSIHLQTYIFSNDATGMIVAEALMAAAKKGVVVYLMADGYASGDISKSLIQQLEAAGVRFRFFEPLFRSENFYFGRRLHHKVAVFDNRCALISGSNIADRYNDLPGQPAWFDMGILVEGDAALEIYDICVKIWEKDKGEKNLLKRKLADIFNYIAKEETVGVRVLQNDWVRHKQEIFYAYHKLFKESKKSITIVCSYFLPGLSLRNRLMKAVKRGVQVRVVLSSISDVAITKHAERWLYRWMLRNNITIYEYQPTILHAKLAVVDDDLLTIGSYNLNALSALASVEMNVLVKDAELAAELKADIDQMIQTKCLLIDKNNYKTNLFSLKHLWQAICYYAVAFLVTIGTFYYRREE